LEFAEKHFHVGSRREVHLEIIEHSLDVLHQDRGFWLPTSVPPYETAIANRHHCLLIIHSIEKHSSAFGGSGRVLESTRSYRNIGRIS
jgi:hypothetical protein